MQDTYKHFGIKFYEDTTPKYMTKENFVNRDDKVNEYLTDYAKEKALKNYDISIEYFKSLDKEEFSKALDNLLKQYAFISVSDLNEVKGKQGIYMLVLDNYKQIYIGQTNRDIKERILRHFKDNIPFKRVPFIHYDTLPIDAFKPLDTTRIYTLFTNNQNTIDEIESNLINIFPNKFMLNKTIGGKANDYMDLAIRLSVGRIKKDISDKEV